VNKRLEVFQQISNTKISLLHDYNDFLDRKFESAFIENNEELQRQIKERKDKVVDEIQKLEDSKNDTGFMELLYQDMPIIPMGKNTDKQKLETHKFKESSGKDSQIKMSKALAADLKRADKSVGETSSSATQVIAVRDAWNGLSDEQRALVDTFEITAVPKKLGLQNIKAGASWNETEKKMMFMVDSKKSVGAGGIRVDGVYKRVHHEIAHAEFAKMTREKPEKVSKFVKTVSSPEMKKTPINHYVSTYSNPKKMLDDNWKRYERKYKQRQLSPEKVAEIKDRYDRNTKQWKETIYADETHSAIVELVSGTKGESPFAGNKSMLRNMDKDWSKIHKQFFNAYEELVS